MKTKILLFSFVIFNSFLFAQCITPQASANLEVNQISVTIDHGGTLISPSGYQLPSLLPGGSGLNLLNAAELWMGGVTPSGFTKVFQTSGIGTNVTSQAGPLDENGQTDIDICFDWDRHWETDSLDVNGFLEDWADGTLDNPVPMSLLAWPGKGNPYFFDENGFELPGLNQHFAPFVDLNLDGIYNPNDGDYPEIKEANKAFYWVYNMVEMNVPDEEAGKMEFHVLAYSYRSVDPVINSSTFFHYNMINKSQESLYNTYAGIWIDPQLGCYTDDYFGCDSINNMAYMYNEDDLDGEPGCSCPGGTSTFCQVIPMVGVKILKGATAGRNLGTNGEFTVPDSGTEPDTIIDAGLSGFMYYNLGGGQPAPPGTFDPNTSDEAYNLLNGKWTDGTSLTVGGSGYNPGSSNVTNFAFSGNPNDDDEWSMCSEGSNALDRRLLLRSGPFEMNSNQSNSLSFAIIHIPDVLYPCPSLDLLQEGVETIESIFTEFVTETKEVTSFESKVSVYPNPFSTQTTISLMDTADGIENIQIYSVSGQLLRSSSYDNSRSVTIEKQDLPSGIYFYNLLTKRGAWLSGKLLIK